MLQTRRGTASLFAIFVCAGLFDGPAQAASARRPRDYTSVRQNFTTGFFQRTYSVAERDEGSYEVLVPDDVKDRELESAVQEEAEHVDEWVYTRSMDASVLYDTNIDTTRIDPQDDVLQNVHGNFGMSRRTEHTYVGLFYDVAHTNYVVREKRNDLRHEFGQNVTYEIGRLTLGVANRFSPKVDFATGQRTELEDDTGEAADRRRVSAITDDLAATARLRLTPKTALRAAYTFQLFDLPLGENSLAQNSFSTHTKSFSTAFDYQWRPKTRITFSAENRSVNYFRGGLYSSHDVVFGTQVRGRLNALTTYKTGLSYSKRDYKNTNIHTTESVAWAGSITRRLTAKTAATLTTTRTQTEQIDAGTGQTIPIENTFCGIDLTWRMTPRTTVQAGGSAGYVFKDQTVTRLDIEDPTHTFTRILEDQLYEWYASVIWEPKPYFTILFGYEYENLNSSFKDNETNVSRWVTSVNTTF